MPDQLELFELASPRRVTVSQGFELLWRYHFGEKASAPHYESNRKAWCRSLGERYFDTVTRFDVKRHKGARLSGLSPFIRTVGPWAVYHDHTLIALLYNKLDEWKRERVQVDGIDFSLIELPPMSPVTGSPKGQGEKRKRIVTPDEWAVLIEHADGELADLMMALIDTSARLGDVLKWEPRHYNPYTDQIEFIQGKTGREQLIPPTKRVRTKFLKAVNRRTQRVYNGRNLRRRWGGLLDRCGIQGIQLGRDFRKTTYNVVRRWTGSGDPPRMLLGHSSNRTGEDHYLIEERSELRPVVNFVAKTYPKKRR